MVGKWACPLEKSQILRYNKALLLEQEGTPPMQDWPEREHYTAEDLIQIIRILRDPEAGCPWDKVQTHQSIRKNFLEETCEALEAIDADDAAMLREELGDVLMQVAFHTVMEEERGRFDFEQVCREVCEKLVFRHPNIFTSSAAENAGINGWDALKNKEKGRRTLADELDTVPATLPALMRAQKLQKRAAGRGLGITTAEDAAAALKQVEQDWDAAPAPNAEQAGELLFAAVNAIRLAGLDAEEALTFASKRFRDELLADQT
jgi:MazG family protein